MPFRIPALLFGLVLIGGFASARADGPPSALARPDRPPPPRLLLGVEAGGAADFDALRVGMAGAVVFPPESAAEFLGFLERWRTSLVLGGARRDLADGVTFRSLEIGLHRPWRGLFVGGGCGIASVKQTTVIAPVDSTAAAETVTTAERAVTWLMEIGTEYPLREDLRLLACARWRRAILRPEDASGWALLLQIGTPLPW